MTRFLGDKREGTRVNSESEVVYRGTVAIDTHGCKLNQSDSERLAREFAEAGYRIVHAKDSPDIYVLNTCTVTHVADAKARKTLRMARGRSPNGTLVATGCYAQRAAGELYKSLGKANLVVGNSGKDNLVAMVLQQTQESAVSRRIAARRVGPNGVVGRTRAMVKIQEGCDQVCAYCIVPKVRGRERSVPPEVLLQQVESRIDEGYKEVVLTGTQLGSYGFDLTGMDLKTLVDLILQRTGIERLRVSSLQPQEITSDLLRSWEDSRLCQHFHMPLQSGSDRILKRMRRRYTTEIYLRTVEMIDRVFPKATVTADIIVGFPGEGEDEFDESLRFCEGIDFADMHVFPYSVRPGTSAAFMGSKVEPWGKKERMERMLSLARTKASEHRNRVLGTVQQVLWEKEDVSQPGMYLGLTDNYLKVRTRSSTRLINRVVAARLVRYQGGVVDCELV